jgi:hypothetical protein
VVKAKVLRTLSDVVEEQAKDAQEADRAAFRALSSSGGGARRPPSLSLSLLCIRKGLVRGFSSRQ